MDTNTETTAFARGIDPVLRIVLPANAERVASFEADPALRARIEELAAKSTEGELSGGEREEYAGYVRANKFVAVLQRQARRILAGSA